MIATRRLWRWLTSNVIEVTEVGQRCDWVTENHVYFHLGWAVKTEE